MAPRDRDIPVPPAVLHRRLAVFDMVYHPPRTRLLAEAERRGCATVGGLSMLAYQGMAAFRLWTGKKARYEDFYGRARAAA
jgi:shikimate dehydrogenase